MERRLQEVLATMDLRVGELAEAVRQMGAVGIPVPVVEAIEDAVKAITIAATEVAGEEARIPRPTSKQGIVYTYLRTLTQEQFATTGNSQVAALLTRLNPANPISSQNISDFYNQYRHLNLPRLSGRGPAPEPSITMPQYGKARMVADYLVALGADSTTTDMDAFLKGISAANPGTTFTSSDYYATVTRFPGLPGLSLRGRGRRGTATTEPAPVVEPAPAPAPAPVVEPPAPVERPALPTTVEEIVSLEERTAAVYMDGLGDALGGKTAEDIRKELSYQWPDITVQQIRNAWNSLRWINPAQGKDRPPMLKASDRPDTVEGGMGGVGDLRPERMQRSYQVLVIIRPGPDWIANKLRFATREEAQEYMDRWTVNIPGLEDSMIAASEDPPNMVDGHWVSE
jgi:hypothetical protein